MRRPQFSIRTMLWLTALVAAFFAGWEGHRQKEERAYQRAWKGAKQMGMMPPIREKLMEAAARNRGLQEAQAASSAQTRDRYRRPLP